MPAVLDSRNHAKLRLKASVMDDEGNPQVLSGFHPENPKIKVEGTHFKSSNGVYAIGVIEPESHELYVFDAKTISVRALVKSPSATLDEDDGPLTGGAYMEKKKDLINTYAPVKKQRQLRAAINSVVSDEKIEGFQESVQSMKQSLEAAEATEGKSKAREQQVTGVLGQMRDLLPPFDLESSIPAEIYDFTSLFPDSLVSSLDPNDENSACHALLRWVHDDFKPVSSSTTLDQDPFMELKQLKTLLQLGRLYGASKQDKRKTCARLFNILASMVFLYRQKRNRKWSAFDVYANDELAQRLAELYSPDRTVGCAIDREGAHKLFAHICLFLLRLTPFWEFDFADIKIDLNVQSKDLLSILSFCGIHVRQTPGKDGMLGILKAPLVVQQAGVVRKGKGTPKRK
jgi:hypothetical protein